MPDWLIYFAAAWAICFVAAWLFWRKMNYDLHRSLPNLGTPAELWARGRWQSLNMRVLAACIFLAPFAAVAFGAYLLQERWRIKKGLPHWWGLV